MSAQYSILSAMTDVVAAALITGVSTGAVGVAGVVFTYIGTNKQAATTVATTTKQADTSVATAERLAQASIATAERRKTSSPGTRRT